jgi:cysteine desulfurase/selenocysteine lyase
MSRAADDVAAPTPTPAPTPSPARDRAADKASDFARLRADFPALTQLVHGRPLAYLDNRAASQCPRQGLDAAAEQQAMNHANVHRGVHALSERATAAFEGARAKVRAYINAAAVEEIVFTRGTTEAINLVAASLGGSRLEPGDEVLITWLEHHSNIVPWQLVCERTGAKLVVAPITDSGELDLDAFHALLGPRTKIVALAHVSNALGTINPVRELVAAAHAHGAVVLVDGAQALPHMRVDVRALDCDFYAFSGHKMFAPTGVGVLYGKRALLDAMPPWQGGGDMILTVSFTRTTYNALPYKFEAGTPNITGVVALGAAVDYLERVDFAALARHEQGLLDLATERLLAEIAGARVIGTAAHKAGVLSFVVDGIHAHDLGTIVDQEGVAIRTGHHCAMPVMDRFGVAATARASFALYNDETDVDRLIAGLKHAQEIFS